MASAPDSDSPGRNTVQTQTPPSVSSLNPDLERHATPTRTHARSAEDIVAGICAGDRVVLSQAITLIESAKSDHRAKAREVVNGCLSDAGDSVRVGVTGVPGVGKSTFIEAIGTQLVDDGHHLAVLAIDPSSTRTKGSILGDKTRMGRLASMDDVFIRPSPTGGSLGGVARTTRETILLVEAAGYDTILVETVGVGQSETTVHSMVDVFLLLALAGAGDELQGIKRGIIEMADVIAINKADGPNREAAETARQEYENALRLFPPPESGWQPPVHTCSAETGEGIDAVWSAINAYVDDATERGHFEATRTRQARYWMHQTIEQRLTDDFFADEQVQAALDDVEARVVDGTLSSFAAADALLDLYRSGAA